MSLGPYRVGDSPATPIQIDIDTEEDLDGYSFATVTVWTPDNIAAASIGPVPLVDDLIEFHFPEGTFSEVGVHWVSIVLSGGEHSLTLDSLPLVVEPTTSEWHTISTARAEWDGADMPDLILFNLLEVAREEVLAYAPRLPIGAAVPLRYRAAQLMHTRNRANAGAAAPGDGGGPDSFIVSPRPLDWVVKQLLRPQRGVGRVG